MSLIAGEPVGGAGGSFRSPALRFIPEEAKQQFRNLLGLKASQIEAVITNLANTVPLTTGYFTDMVINLPKARVMKMSQTGAAGERLFFSEFGRELDEEEMIELAEGSYGTIYKTASNKIIKKITASDADIGTKEKIEGFLKELVCEVFIQTVLSNDEDFGHHVPQVTGIFATEALVRESNRRKRMGGVRQTPQQIKDKFTVYIVMEPCDEVLNRYLAPSGAALRSITMGQMSELMITLGNALQYFQETYGFQHGDLHSNNIMIKHLPASGGAGGGSRISLKIIDFGKACITVGGVTYSKVGRVCNELDLLIFLGSIRMTLYQYLQDDVKTIVKWFFLRKDGMDLYRYLEAWMAQMTAAGHQLPLAQIFHYFYKEYSLGDAIRGWPNQPWGVDTVQKPGQTLYQLFFESGVTPQRVSPEMFLWRWQNPGAADPPALVGGGRRAKGRKPRRKTRRLSRK